MSDASNRAPEDPRAVEDYDPMIYDAMREAANRLKGVYVLRQGEASSEHDRQYWLEKQIAVRRQVEAVDTYSLDAVQTLRASFVARLEAEDQ